MRAPLNASSIRCSGLIGWVVVKFLQKLVLGRMLLVVGYADHRNQPCGSSGLCCICICICFSIFFVFVKSVGFCQLPRTLCGSFLLCWSHLGSWQRQRVILSSAHLCQTHLKGDWYAGSPGRSVLKIHFFIESGLKMIQFKTKSGIFIQKRYSFNRILNIQ